MSRLWPADGEPSQLGRRLHHHGDAGHRRVCQQLAERRDPDRARADRRVPVALGAARVQRVVGVHQPEPAGPDRRLQRVERRRHPARRREVVPGRPRMAGVEADADHRVVLQRGEVGAEVLDRGRQRLPAAGRRLDQQPRAVVGRPSSTGSSRSRSWRRAASYRSSPTAEPACTTTPGSRAGRRGPGCARSRRPTAPTVASVGEPTLTRNGVWMNEGTPRSRSPRRTARPAPGLRRSASSRADCRRTPAPRRRRRRRCRRSPPVASPPLIWMCAPIGGAEHTREGSPGSAPWSPTRRPCPIGRLPADAVAEEGGRADLAGPAW